MCTASASPLRALRLPYLPDTPIAGSVMQVQMALVLVALEPTVISVETIIRERWSTVSELGYLSLVFQAIASQYPSMWINGFADHLLLYLTPPEAGVAPAPQACRRSPQGSAGRAPEPLAGVPASYLPPVPDLRNGWWTRNWLVQTAPAFQPPAFVLPPPLPPDAANAAGLHTPMALTISAMAPTLLMVEAFSRQETVVPGELAYVARVLQAIAAVYQVEAVQDDRDSPLLRSLPD